MQQPVRLLLISAALALAPACQGQVITQQAGPGGGGELTATRGMSSKRAAHTATLLESGRVLITGGFVGDGGGLSSSELFDPERGAFTSAPNMKTARSGHTATRLPGGKVLIAGGYNGGYLATTEIYDPVTNRFAPAGAMTAPRSGHVATLLNDGRVLLAGGVGTGWTFLSTAEIYDPRTGVFTATGSMSVARESHTATLLADGRVLVTGGHRGRRAAITIYTSCEIFDPTTGTFTSGGNMTVKRHKHEAVALRDGRVLIVGGSDERDGDGAYKNAEIYDPRSKSFSAVANNMTTARYKLQGTVILLKNGKVLIAGGAHRAEVFDPATNRFLPVSGDMGTKRLFATATLLNDGAVLIAGGYSDGNTVSENAWLYRGV